MEALELPQLLAYVLGALEFLPRACLQPSFSKTAACLSGRNVAEGIDMAKKKARRQKPKGPQTPPLEDLLRAGESVLYGPRSPDRE